MYPQIFIAILSAALVTFGLGFAAGYQKGEESLTSRMKYLLLKDENASLKLACLNMQDCLIRNGIAIPVITSYEYEPEYESEEAV